MANEGRFLNKRFIDADGLKTSDGRFILFEGGKWVMEGGTAVGDGGSGIAKVISSSATVTLTHGSTVGSLNYSVDIAVTGVQVGDVILATPVASLPLGAIWNAACYSAGTVNIRSFSTGSHATAAIAGTAWRIVALRFS